MVERVVILPLDRIQRSKVNLMPEGGPFKAQAVKQNDSATKCAAHCIARKRMKSFVCRVHHSESTAADFQFPLVADGNT